MLKITLRQLETFAAVSRYGNLSRASEEMSLTKGALSQTLQQLESQLDTPLFDRVHPRLQLNAEGRKLQPLVEEVLARVADIEALYQPTPDGQGFLRVGCSQTIGNYLMPALMAQLQRQHQPCPELLISNSHTLCEKLLHFELDIALIEGENHQPELETQEWMTDEMIIVAPPTHPLCQHSQVSFNDLNQQPFVLREPQSGSREHFDWDVLPHLTQCGPIFQFNTLEAVMLAVEQGLGLTLISSLAAADRLKQGRLVRLPFCQQFPRQLRLIWHRRKYHTRMMSTFIEQCLQSRTLIRHER